MSNPAVEATVPPMNATSKAGILIVDDEIQVRDFLKIALGRNGFVPWLAANHREALDLYRLHQDEIAFALLEVNLPEKSGPETLKQLRQINPGLRACYMSTGFNYTPLQCGTRLFAKPFRVDEVCDFLEEAIADGMSRSTTIVMPTGNEILPATV